MKKWERAGVRGKSAREREKKNSTRTEGRQEGCGSRRDTVLRKRPPLRLAGLQIERKRYQIAGAQALEYDRYEMA